MALHECRVVAVEGTHASGKTTLVHALTAHYRAQGVLVDCVDEPARSSPFVEDVVLRGEGHFDIELEVDLFAAQLTTQLRASRHNALVICDKSIFNVAAYARLVLADRLPLLPAGTGPVLDAIDTFCAAWAYTYDLILYCPDHYAPDGDPLRARVNGLQTAAGDAVRDSCRAAHNSPIELPPGLDVGGRVAAAASHIDPLIWRLLHPR